jgi:hypothetical protein
MSQGGSSSLSHEEEKFRVKRTSISDLGIGFSRININGDIIVHLIKYLGEV